MLGGSGHTGAGLYVNRGLVANCRITHNGCVPGEPARGGGVSMSAWPLSDCVLCWNCVEINIGNGYGGGANGNGTNRPWMATATDLDGRNGIDAFGRRVDLGAYERVYDGVMYSNR